MNLYSLSQEICDNGIDDDGDGLIDMNDQADCNCSLFDVIPREYIPNPSFEDSLCCPNGPAQLNCADAWIQASDATSDYFDTCGYSGIINPPNLPIPGGGSSYVGIISGTGYTEYVGTCLDTALESGENFTLSFYTAWASGDSVVDFTIFGTSQCTDLPWFGTNCPAGIGNWELLANQIISYDTIGEWIVVNLSFTPSFNVNAIALGPNCGSSSGNNGLNYYYVDELILDSTSSFPAQISGSNGFNCQDDAILYAGTSYTGGTWQWYKSGIALVGETDSILDTEPYGYGSYSAVYSNDSGCIRPHYYVGPPIFPDADFSIQFDTCTGQAVFTNNSTISEGEITNIYWQFGDGGQSIEPDPTHLYTSNDSFYVQLLVFSPDGCPDTSIQLIAYDFDINADFSFGNLSCH